MRNPHTENWCSRCIVAHPELEAECGTATVKAGAGWQRRRQWVARPRGRIEARAAAEVGGAQSPAYRIARARREVRAERKYTERVARAISVVWPQTVYLDSQTLRRQGGSIAPNFEKRTLLIGGSFRIAREN